MKYHNDHTNNNSARHSKVHGNTIAASTGVSDPACGMPVDPATAISHQHANMTHYFCSEPCREKFRVVPKRYLSATLAVHSAALPDSRKIA